MYIGQAIKSGFLKVSNGNYYFYPMAPYPHIRFTPHPQPGYPQLLRGLPAVASSPARLPWLRICGVSLLRGAQGCTSMEILLSHLRFM